MSGKASSRSPWNIFRRSKHSTQEGTKNGDHQAGTVVASPFVSATPSESIAGSFMTSRNASQPAESSPFPAGTELRSPEQFAASPGPFASSVLTAEAVKPQVIDNHSSSGSPAFPHAEYTRANPQSQPRDVTSHQTSADENMKFWDEAYDELKKQDPELIRAYEKILSHDYETQQRCKGSR